MELVHDLPFFMHDRPMLVLYGHHPQQFVLAKSAR